MQGVSHTRGSQRSTMITKHWGQDHRHSRGSKSWSMSHLCLKSWTPGADLENVCARALLNNRERKLVNGRRVRNRKKKKKNKARTALQTLLLGERTPQFLTDGAVRCAHRIHK